MASGRGSNFHAILKETRNGNLPNVEIRHLIVNNRKAKAIEVAKEYEIPYTIIESKDKTRNDFERKVLDLFKIENIEIVVLAGFMRILTARFIKHYKNRFSTFIHHCYLPFLVLTHIEMQSTRE